MNQFGSERMASVAIMDIAQGKTSRQYCHATIVTSHNKETIMTKAKGNATVTIAYNQAFIISASARAFIS